MDASGNQGYLALSLDGAAEVAYGFTGVAAGSHTVSMRWKVSGSTYRVQSGFLRVREAKK